MSQPNRQNYGWVKQLFLKERQRTFSWLDASDFQLDDFEKHTQGEHIFVALLDDIPVGFISIWTPTNFIHHLYVDQNYQGQKIGTALIKTAITDFKLPLTLKCLEKNSKAVEFYKKTGFTEKKRGQSVNGTYIFFELSKEMD